MDIISIILFHFLRLVYIYWEPIFLRLQYNLKCPDIRILNAVYILFSVAPHDDPNKNNSFYYYTRSRINTKYLLLCDLTQTTLFPYVKATKKYCFVLLL